jgi:hypothetical protein
MNFANSTNDPNANADEAAYPCQRLRGHKRDTWYTCRVLCQLAGYVLAIVSAVSWVPGLGIVLLLVFGWFLPAAALVGGLMLLQWPIMCWMSSIQRSHRQRQRQIRQAFAFPANPGHLPASHKLRPPR